MGLELTKALPLSETEKLILSVTETVTRSLPLGLLSEYSFAGVRQGNISRHRNINPEKKEVRKEPAAIFENITCTPIYESIFDTLIQNFQGIVTDITQEGI
jgi:hypothetical protein